MITTTLEGQQLQYAILTGCPSALAILEILICSSVNSLLDMTLFVIHR